MVIPIRSEKEWEEFFESDEFDYTAFIPTEKQKKEQEFKRSSIDIREIEEKEKLIKELIKKFND